MTPFTARVIVCVVVFALLAARASGIVGAGSLSEAPVNAGVPVTHGWLAIPEPEGTRSIILHLPPRGVVSERSGRVIGAPEGEARVATTLASMPAGMGAIGDQLAMVFADAGGGVTNLHGRPVLALTVVQGEPGVWRAASGPRLETLPSLRADGVLLGFTGSPQGYAALLQGLSGKGEDPKTLVLQVLTRGGWVSVPVPPEAQSLAGANFEVRDSKPVSRAAWRLFATEAGLGLMVIPPRKANEPVHGTTFLADFGGSPAGGTPSATWTQRELSVPVQDSAPTDQVEVVGSADHIVVSVVNANGRVRVFTQPVAAPVAWREVAAFAGATADCALVAMDGVGRVGVVSHTRAKTNKDAPSLRITEVSARTGSVAYDGGISLGSPISGSDYRFVGVVLAYVTGLVAVFLWRPTPKDSVHLPPGVSLAEPGRRMLASLIDLCIGVLIACRIIGIPVGEFLGSGLWNSGPAQNAMFVALGLLVVTGGVLEALLGRSLGKMVTGCAVVEMHSGTGGGKAKDGGAKTPLVWKSLLRNAVKWGLPPLALFGLLDAGGRHKGDQLAGTAVVVEDDGEDDSTPES